MAAINFDNQLATKSDISRLEIKLIEHESEFKLIKWKVGIILGGVIALVLKSFFSNCLELLPTLI